MENELVQVLVDWGCFDLFLSAFLAGSVVPFSSEAVLVTLVSLGVNPVWGILWATVGNTLGTLTCFGIGYLGKEEWIERYLKVKPARVRLMRRFLRGKGALMAFFTFLPTFGELIAITLGYMRANIYLTVVSMFVGKMVRYIVILLAANHVISYFA